MSDAPDPNRPAQPYPAPSPDTDFFWTSGESGILRFKQCAACGHYLHPPKPRCPDCLSDRIEIVAVSGRATVAAKTVNYHPWHPAFPPPYVLAIVEIAEAPYVRLTTRIVTADPEGVAIGDAVRVRFEQAGPAWLPLFEPEAK
jgi:uncharacterized OB-fold protein